MPFRIDPNAAQMPDDNERLTRDQVAPLLKGSQFIYESLTDNVERWMLSAGGQFVRQSGFDGSRYHVVPPSEAYEALDGLAPEARMADLRDVLDRHGIEYQRSAAYAM
jgi:hypothetical protein